MNEQKYITTFVDGSDVKEVNLWNHKTNRTEIVATCHDGEIVTVLETDGVYSKVKTSEGKTGWCMNGFLR